MKQIMIGATFGVCALTTLAAASAQDFETRVKGLQQGWSNEYLSVTIPDYSDQKNLWTELRLYRDHLDFLVNLNDPRKNSQWWKDHEAIGNIKPDGSGYTYYFGNLAPCSEIKPKITNTITMYFELTGQACLKHDLIEFRLKIRAESRGQSTEQMKIAGVCKALPSSDNCNMVEDPFFAFVVFPK